MSALILIEKETKLFLREGQICCKIASDVGRIFPWKGIQHIVLGNSVEISTQLILKLAEKEISLLVHGTKNNELASIVPLKAPTSAIKLQQYQVFADKECCKRLSIILLTIKANMQFNNLKKLNMGIDPMLFSERDQLKTNSNLMLQEAKISKYYWQKLTSILNMWGFKGRVRRPPTDPINALFSLTSTMVDSLYNQALLKQGLDLGMGFHHQTGYRRQSLICDLKELSRSDLEYWVISLFLKETLTQAHFDNTPQGCRLNRAGQTLFYKAWYTFTDRHKVHVHHICTLAKKIILREVKNAK
ncbi:CRISPR-associated endonuclease Cas1 [uncultured Psychromonas sp.]|uniref:CRISPR-associated endonuclease Cas1 n=1 Tax=uncultured Psychromonas sp. TaxID=173974 RepID=UPI0026307CFB|nr:CRISPR-associated endonuclease Cas1 [uncultured Psychromonas sp.]